MGQWPREGTGVLSPATQRAGVRLGKPGGACPYPSSCKQAPRGVRWRGGRADGRAAASPQPQPPRGVAGAGVLPTAGVRRLPRPLCCSGHRPPCACLSVRLATPFPQELVTSPSSLHCPLVAVASAAAGALSPCQPHGSVEDGTGGLLAWAAACAPVLRGPLPALCPQLRPLPSQGRWVVPTNDTGTRMAPISKLSPKYNLPVQSLALCSKLCAGSQKGTTPPPQGPPGSDSGVQVTRPGSARPRRPLCFSGARWLPSRSMGRSRWPRAEDGGSCARPRAQHPHLSSVNETAVQAAPRWARSSDSTTPGNARAPE